MTFLGVLATPKTFLKKNKQRLGDLYMKDCFGFLKNQIVLVHFVLNDYLNRSGEKDEKYCGACVGRRHKFASAYR